MGKVLGWGGGLKGWGIWGGGKWYVKGVRVGIAGRGWEKGGRRVRVRYS